MCGKDLVPYNLPSVSVRPKVTVVHFEGVDDVDAAASMSGHELLLPVAALPTLNGLQFYYHEVIGFELSTKPTAPWGTSTPLWTCLGTPCSNRSGKEKRACSR